MLRARRSNLSCWALCRVLRLLALAVPSKNPNFKAFGPKDPIIYNFRAILVLRVSFKVPCQFEIDCRLRLRMVCWVQTEFGFRA